MFGFDQICLSFHRCFHLCQVHFPQSVRQCCIQQIMLWHDGLALEGMSNGIGQSSVFRLSLPGLCDGLNRGGQLFQHPQLIGL